MSVHQAAVYVPMASVRTTWEDINVPVLMVSIKILREPLVLVGVSIIIGPVINKQNVCMQNFHYFLTH